METGSYLAHLEYEALNLREPYKQQGLSVHRISLISEKIHEINSENIGIKVLPRFNSSKSYGFPEIIINEKVLLTIKTNDDPLTLPIHSNYRKEYSSMNPPYNNYQGSLFESEEDLIRKKWLSQDDKVNGIITYKVKNANFDFVSIVFPCCDYKSTHGRIDVIKDCSEYIERKRASQEKTSSPLRKPIDIEKKLPKLRKQGN